MGVWLLRRLYAHFYFMKTDLIGKRFNRWLVLKESKSIKTKTGTTIFWLCKCDCDKERSVRASDLVNGKSKSCGCLRIEELIKRTATHGKIYTPEYYIWSGMKDRCINPNNKGYKNYGGRGIKVCDRWFNSFENFISDMGNKPTPYHSLDRHPDNNGNYEPSNCRWATDEEQSRGKRNNRIIECKGLTMILMDWAKYLRISQSTLGYHLKTKSIDEVVMYYNKKRQM